MMQFTDTHGNKGTMIYALEDEVLGRLVQYWSLETGLQIEVCIQHSGRWSGEIGCRVHYTSNEEMRTGYSWFKEYEQTLH